MTSGDASQSAPPFVATTWAFSFESWALPQEPPVIFCQSLRSVCMRS